MPSRYRPPAHILRVHASVGLVKMDGMTANPVKIGINGLGRIGRCVLRAAHAREDVQVVAVNDLAPLEELAYLLSFDSVHGRWRVPVEVGPGHLQVAGTGMAATDHAVAANIDWGAHDVDVVLECTGKLTRREDAARHLQAGARRVCISAPSKDADGAFVYGVNHERFDPGAHQVVSMASCTTNCIAPVASVLLDSFGIETLMMTTVHAYTISQPSVDTHASKRRRGRAAAVNIIPTSTGAAVATAQILPALAGKIHGLALRVPVPNGSIVDAVVTLGRDASVDEVNAALRSAAKSGPLAGILDVVDDELVSSDIIGDEHSAVVDATSTTMVGARTVKVLAWYDNEWGYATRLLDFAAYATQRARERGA